MSRLAKTATALAVLLAVGGWMSAQEGEVAESVASDRSGKGVLTMSLGGVEDGAGERFAAQVTAKDGSAHPAFGGVTIVGLEGISGGAIGDVDWQISGSTVTGKLVEHGKELGVFTGTISSTGVSGQVTLHDGRTGLWSWDGPLPSAAPADGGSQ